MPPRRYSPDRCAPPARPMKVVSSRRRRWCVEWLLALGAVAALVATVCLYPAPFALVVDHLGAASLALAGGRVLTHARTAMASSRVLVTA